MGTPLDYAPFEAPFGAHGEQGKQGKKFKIEGEKIRRAERRDTEAVKKPL